VRSVDLAKYSLAGGGRLAAKNRKLIIRRDEMKLACADTHSAVKTRRRDRVSTTPWVCDFAVEVLGIGHDLTLFSGDIVRR